MADSIVSEDRKAASGTVYALIEDQASRAPDAIAFHALGRVPLSYGRMFAQIKETIRVLNDIGLERGDVVAVVLPGGPEVALAFLSVASCAVCAPLNPAYTAFEFDVYLRDLDAKAVIVPAGSSSPSVSAARACEIPVIELLPHPDGAAGTFTLRCDQRRRSRSTGAAHAADIALVLHTSGTTSRSKQVPLSHENLCLGLAELRRALALTHRDRWLQIMPLFHLAGLIMLLLSLSAGGSVVCTSGFDAASFFRCMDEYRPTWFMASPATHRMILENANADVIARCPLRFLLSSGAPLPVSTIIALEELFKAPLIDAYGMTETVIIAMSPLPPRERKPGSVGVPVGADVAIVSSEDAFLPAGQMGEVVVRGPNVMRAYPEANATSFIDGWFKTGDQGYFDAEGYLYLTGRIKEIINRGGEKVSPPEVEAVLLQHPAVREAVTFAVPHPSLGEDVAAAVVFQQGAHATEREIRALAAERLADHKVPRQIVILEAIPRGPTGKVQRVMMAQQLAVELSARYEPPRTAVEKTLAGIWMDMLRVHRVGIFDNFFELGGHSMLATQMVIRLRLAFGVNIPLRALLEAPVLSKLARVIEGAPRGGDVDRFDLQASTTSRAYFGPNGHGPPPFAHEWEHGTPIEVDGATLHVLAEGDPARGARLFIPGLCCEGAMWNPVVAALPRAGDERAHLTFDLRGLGRSTGFPISLAQLADDAAAVLASHAHGPAQVVGHSAGAVAAVELARRHPSLVESLVLLNWMPVSPSEVGDLMMAYVDIALEAGTLALVFGPGTNYDHIHDHPAYRVVGPMLAGQDPAVFAAMVGIFTAPDVHVSSGAALAALVRDSLPAVLVSAENDQLTPAAANQAVAERLGVPHVVIADSGHDTLVQQPAAVATVILSAEARGRRR